MKIMKSIVSLFLSMVLSQQAWALALNGVRNPDGTVVYTGDLNSPGKAVCGGDYSGNLDFEIRYDKLTSDYEKYYTLKFEASSPGLPMKEIRGNWQQGQRVKAPATGSKISFRLTLTPIPTPNPTVFSDNILRAGHTLLQGKLWLGCFFSSGVMFGTTNLDITAANDVPLAETCQLALAADRTVKLEDVFLQKVKTQAEVYGATFPIQLTCNDAVTVSQASISYSDGVTPSTRGDVLSTDTALDGAAQNIGLKIYDQANPNTPIRYAPAPSTQFLTPTSEISLFEGNIQRKRTYTKNYKVYYTKTGGTPTAGTVTARLKYNIYYR